MRSYLKVKQNPALKKAVKVVASDVGEGKTIAEALSKQKIFSKLYCNLVKAGEVGGILDEILQKLADHLDRTEKTKSASKVRHDIPCDCFGRWDNCCYCVDGFCCSTISRNAYIQWKANAMDYSISR